MANKGASTNGSVAPSLLRTVSLLKRIHRSQFYLTFRATPHLDNKHTVFGKLVGGDDVLNALEKLTLKAGTERPLKEVRITEVIMYALYSLLLPRP